MVHKVAVFAVWILAVASILGYAQNVQPSTPDISNSAGNFAPLEQWRTAVIAGDAAGLQKLYSTGPAATTMKGGGNLLSGKEDVDYLLSLKQSGLTDFKLDIIKIATLQPGLEEAFFQVAAKVKSNSGPQTLYFSSMQLWNKQNNDWRIVVSSRTPLTKLRKPDSLTANIYPEDADAKKEIREAVERAGKNHKRVILVFGGNWCYDCHMLDLAFRHSELTPILDANYEVVHVDVGEFKKNLDIAAQYKVPLNKGVPALAVLDSDGKLLFSQTQGEWENALNLSPEKIVAFLNEWKPQTAVANKQ